MIGSALRSEIRRCCAALSDGPPETDLARCALAAHRLMHGRQGVSTEEALPSARALTALIERSVEGAPADFLAYQALCEYLLAQLRLEGGSFDRAEEALDAIDNLVEDPAQLPTLRESLRHFAKQFEQFCHEVTLAPRRQPERRVSAA